MAERWGPSQPLGSDPMITSALGASQPVGPSAQSLPSLSDTQRLFDLLARRDFAFSHS